MGVLIQNEQVVGGLDAAVAAKIGTDNLTTTASDLSGAVNELDAELGDEALPDPSKTVKGNINSLKQSLSLLGGGNFSVLTYFNATKIEIDMGFVPTGSKLGMAVLFNSNQGEADFLNLAASPGIGHIAGTKSWTSAISGTTITFTPNNTLWGITMVLLLHN